MKHNVEYIYENILYYFNILNGMECKALRQKINIESSEENKKRIFLTNMKSKRYNVVSKIDMKLEWFDDIQTSTIYSTSSPHS